MARLINLEVNDSGAWRRVTSFDLDTLEEGFLEHCAGDLLAQSSNHKLRARFIQPGDSAPLLTWSLGEGWREWREAA